eukprot:TRINITY_DN363_c0_g1_i7.p1 TRINITY_DN363_c0_g1~~TRINITY_DN363_c0_g1_i7.p1  ORF type:complete len:278 (-),score=68.33 TRINITY_DN363_c0_g1_i7:364-1197(-)
MSEQLNFLMNKLYVISKDLGGPSATEMKDVNKDEFMRLNTALLENLSLLRKKQHERDEKREKHGKNPDVIRLSSEIREKISECEGQLSNMSEVLRKQVKNKKISKQEEGNRNGILNKLRDLHSNIQSHEKGGVPLPDDSNFETLTDLRSNGGGSDRDYKARTMTADEEAGIKRWQEKDKAMDEDLEQIIQGVLKWKEKAINIGEQIDRMSPMLNNLERNVEDTTGHINHSNKRLKDIITKYRAPNKFCLDIILVLIILGLCGMIYNMLKSKSQYRVA